jgi:hypothetical protein
MPAPQSGHFIVFPAAAAGAFKRFSQLLQRTSIATSMSFVDRTSQGTFRQTAPRSVGPRDPHRTTAIYNNASSRAIIFHARG